MAKIVFQTDNVIQVVKDETPLIECCDAADVSLSFGCTEGTCGVCELTVVKGFENCSQLTAAEKDYLLPEDIDGGMRLGCQLTIKRGEIAITWKNNRAE